MKWFAVHKLSAQRKADHTYHGPESGLEQHRGRFAQHATPEPGKISAQCKQTKHVACYVLSCSCPCHDRIQDVPRPTNPQQKEK